MGKELEKCLTYSSFNVNKQQSVKTTGCGLMTRLQELCH